MNEINNKKTSITNLATTTDLTAVENKIPNVSNLITKTDYSTKIIEIENESTTDHDYKYITTQEFNKLTLEDFTARLAQAKLASKSDISIFVRKALDKNELKELSKKVKAITIKRLTKIFEK